MNRGAFSKALGRALAATVFPTRVFAANEGQAVDAADVHKAIPDGLPSRIAMPIHPAFIPLDPFGPHVVFASLGNVNIHLAWKPARR